MSWKFNSFLVGYTCAMGVYAQLKITAKFIGKLTLNSFKNAFIGWTHRTQPEINCSCWKLAYSSWTIIHSWLPDKYNKIIYSLTLELQKKQMNILSELANAPLILIFYIFNSKFVTWHSGLNKFWCLKMRGLIGNASPRKSCLFFLNSKIHYVWNNDAIQDIYSGWGFAQKEV